MSIFGFTFIYTAVFNTCITLGMLVLIRLICHFIIFTNLLNVIYTRWLVRVLLLGSAAFFMNPLAMEERFLSTGIAATTMATTAFLGFTLAAMANSIGKIGYKDSFKVTGGEISFFLFVYGLIMLIWTSVYFANSGGRA